MNENRSFAYKILRLGRVLLFRLIRILVVCIAVTLVFYAFRFEWHRQIDKFEYELQPKNGFELNEEPELCPHGLAGQRQGERCFDCTPISRKWYPKLIVAGFIVGLVIELIGSKAIETWWPRKKKNKE